MDNRLSIDKQKGLNKMFDQLQLQYNITVIDLLNYLLTKKRYINIDNVIKLYIWVEHKLITTNLFDNTSKEVNSLLQLLLRILNYRPILRILHIKEEVF